MTDLSPMMKGIWTKRKRHNSFMPLALFIAPMIVLCLAACGQKKSSKSYDERPVCNSIYYWKTRFALNDYELKFLKEHDIHKMYVKFFDVDDDTSSPYAEARRIVPVATAVFESPKPDSVEIIPTVYLTVRSIKSIQNSQAGSKEAARKIVTRVLNMADYNDMGPVHEVQLDCDWTEKTQDAYFSLCKEIGSLLHGKGIALSSTIRLHQLRTEAPPVDRGVLMLYNTGRLQDSREKNSIISAKEVASYFKDKHIEYSVPLDFAYPTYSWGLVFSGNRFLGILHKSDFSDTELYSPQEDGFYKVIKSHYVDGEYLYEGHRIRLEKSPVKTVLEVKALVNEAFPHARHNTVIYHLDSLNLSEYTSDEIKNIYSN